MKIRAYIRIGFDKAPKKPEDAIKVMASAKQEFEPTSKMSYKDYESKKTYLPTIYFPVDFIIADDVFDLDKHPVAEAQVTFNHSPVGLEIINEAVKKGVVEATAMVISGRKKRVVPKKKNYTGRKDYW